MEKHISQPKTCHFLLLQPSGHMNRHCVCLTLLCCCLHRLATTSRRHHAISPMPPSTMSAFLHLHFSFSHHMKLCCLLDASVMCIDALLLQSVGSGESLSVLFCSQEANTNTENTETSTFTPAPKAHSPHVKKMKVRVIVYSVCVYSQMCLCLYYQPATVHRVSVGLFPQSMSNSSDIALQNHQQSHNTTHPEVKGTITRLSFEFNPNDADLNCF